MANKELPDVTLDESLIKIATGSRMSICSAHPANFAGIAAVSLGDIVMVPGDGNDYTIADGTVSGRKVTVGQKAGLTVVTAGTGSHLVLDDGATILTVTTTTPQVLAISDSVTVPAWEIELRDPV